MSHAKLACADAAWTAGRKGIQVHGAMGLTNELRIEEGWRFARVMRCAIVASGTRNARAISSLESPTMVESVRAALSAVTLGRAS